jgi:hypothetical protein
MAPINSICHAATNLIALKIPSVKNLMPSASWNTKSQELVFNEEIYELIHDN